MYFLATDLLSCLRFEFDSWFYVSLFMIRWPFFSPFSTLLIFGLSSSLFALLCSLKELELPVSLVRFLIWERNCPDEWMKLIRLWSTYGLAVCVCFQILFEIWDEYTERNVWIVFLIYTYMSDCVRKTFKWTCISFSLLSKISKCIFNFYFY